MWSHIGDYYLATPLMRREFSMLFNSFVDLIYFSYSQLMIEQLLDTGSFHDRTQLIAAMHRLSARTELYPKGFFLEGIELSADDVPVGSDGFCDIYKIIFKGEETCFKVLRVNQQSRVEDIAKVYAKEAILWAQLSHPNILPFFGLAKQ
ncbi:hypothetical protein H0H93_007440 [Arthromyces matolae]|nr:hypothetical protein H0H93_007440 [Arthromyces matolae]